MTEQQQAARQSMIEWLSDENELGKAPSKIEIAEEFDRNGLHYYIFKYKKSFLGKWLIGVCGGYRGNGTTNCGHVYSEMEPYDPQTALEKAEAMVEMLRQYWMERAKKERSAAKQNSARARKEGGKPPAGGGENAAGDNESTAEEHNSAESKRDSTGRSSRSGRRSGRKHGPRGPQAGEGKLAGELALDANMTNMPNMANAADKAALDGAVSATVKGKDIIGKIAKAVCAKVEAEKTGNLDTDGGAQNITLEADGISVEIDTGHGKNAAADHSGAVSITSETAATEGKDAPAPENTIAASVAAGARRSGTGKPIENSQNDVRSSGPLAGFVLLDSDQWDFKKLQADLIDDWRIVCADSLQSSEDGQAHVFDADGVMISVSFMPVPVPDGKAERCAAANYLWPEAAEVTKTQKAHITVSVMSYQGELLDAGKLFVKVCAACLKQPNAIGAYTSGTVFQPAFYLKAAEIMKAGDLPVFNWIYFGLYRGEDGMNGYTYGLKAFGKSEIEVLGSKQDPRNIRNLLYDIAYYVLDRDVILRDGETIGFTADQKLSITRSKGVSIGGQTFKIGY